MEKIKPYAFLLGAALLYCHGFPNHLGILFPLGPILATVILFNSLIEAKSLKKRIFIYLFYNSLINIYSFSWITGTLQEFGNLPLPLAIGMNSLYALVFNPHIWVLIIALTILERRFPRFNELVLSRSIAVPVAALVLTLLEYYIPQQFPVMLGQPWIIFGKLLAAIPVLGLFGFSFFSYLAVFELLSIKKHKSFSAVNIGAIFIFVCLNFTPLYSPPEAEKRQANIRMVQANISNFLKTDSESGGYHSVTKVQQRYEELSLEKSQDKIDLIIWPETAYPYPIETHSENLMATHIPQIFKDIVFKQNSAILFGGYDHFRDNPDGSYYQTEYNAALLINTLGQLENVYHKHVLIPFGETLPLGPFNKTVSQYIPEMAFFKEGSRKTLFVTEQGLKFITTICYEKLRPEFVRNYLNKTTEQPHLMINLTNDSWYGDTLEPELHLFLARWRSAEFRIPTIRSTNTGISTLIDKYGIETKRLGYNETGNLDVKLNFPLQSQPKTPFQDFGNSLTLLLAAFLFIFQGILLKYKYVKN